MMILKKSGKPVAILQCVSHYPIKPKDANLRVMKTFEKVFDCIVGYSDHSMGITVPVAAVALGAKIIEKHFTLDKTRSTFHDHQLSADPDDFQEMVTRIRAVETMISDGPSLEPTVYKTDVLTSGMVLSW